MFGRKGPRARDRVRATMRMALIPAIWLGVLLPGAAGAEAATGGGGVLTASDVVAIRIVDHPDLDWTARVEPDGTINFSAGPLPRSLGFAPSFLLSVDKAPGGRPAIPISLRYDRRRRRALSQSRVRAVRPLQPPSPGFAACDNGPKGRGSESRGEGLAIT